MKAEHKAIVLSIILGLFAWVFDAVVDYLFFYEGPFWGILISDDPSQKVYIRPFIVAYLLTFGLLTSRSLAKLKRSEEVLRESKERLDKFMNSATDGFFLLDSELDYLEINKVGLEIIGLNKEEIVGKNVLDIVPDIKETGRYDKYMEVIKTGRPFFIDDFVPHPKFGDVHLALRAFKIENNLGIITIDITERKRAQEKIEHLNLVLRAIRKVNQLIAKEKDRDKLLKAICKSLIENRGYYNTWITVLDESGGIVTTADAGLGRDFLSMVERLKRGELPYCGRRALKQSEVVVIKDPLSTCSDCPLSGKYRGRGAMSVRLEYGGKVYGLLTVSIPTELTAKEEEQSLLKEVAEDIAFALHDIELEEEMKEKSKQIRNYARQMERAYKTLERAYLDMIQALVISVETRDPYTRGHSERVTQYSKEIAKKMGWKEQELKNLELACRIHDIGKIGISDRILLKNDKLTIAEWAEMKMHPVRGAEMLTFSEFLRPVIPIVRHHHERWDGKGYPDGLKGEEIPLGARIMAVADAFDAMSSTRPYRDTVDLNRIVEELKENARTQFDPQIVKIWLEILEEHRKIPDTQPLSIPNHQGPPSGANLKAIKKRQKKGCPPPKRKSS